MTGGGGSRFAAMFRRASDWLTGAGECPKR